MSANINFYKDLKPFGLFEEFPKKEYYKSLPKDWDIFVADIKGSTKAIERGNYRSVNTIGSAVITTCIRALKDFDFPFVFGGDGASLCVPSESSELISKKLSELANLSKKKFGLELRVAKIPASKIYENNTELLVAKYEITKGRCIAVFRGGGMSLADDLAKEHYDTYKVQESSTTLSELEGISCRWNPIPAKKDHIVSLLVAPTKEGNEEVFEQIVDTLKDLLQENLHKGNPVNLEDMSYKGFFEQVNDEVRYHRSLFSFAFIKRFIEIIAANLIFKLGLPAVVFDKKEYSNSMATHSDSKKFDDILRVIADLGKEELHTVEAFLSKMHEQGEIYYGIHLSKTALMTCYIEDLTQGNHLHFIDGGDGGYAMAAKQMKAQMQKA